MQFAILMFNGRPDVRFNNLREGVFREHAEAACRRYFKPEHGTSRIGASDWRMVAKGEAPEITRLHRTCDSGLNAPKN